MAYLSGKLADVLEDIGWTQKQLADAVTPPLPPSQISRYLNKRGARIPVESFERLLAALPAETHAGLLVAYLLDCIPQGYAHLVKIAPAEPPAGDGATSQSVLVEGIDRELDSYLRVYAQLGMRHREVRDVLRSFLAAQGSLPPGPISPEA